MDKLSGAHHRGRKLIASFKSETGNEIDANGVNLMLWLTIRLVSSNADKNTFICYRKWVSLYLYNIGHPAASALREWTLPYPKSILNKVTKKQAVTVAKQKLLKNGELELLTYIGIEEFNLFIMFLISETKSSGQLRYINGPSVGILFHATRMTGLRPSEWADAKFHDIYHDQKTGIALGPVLEVRTLKQNSRRGDNPLRNTRLLILDRWTKHQIVELKLALDLFAPSSIASGDSWMLFIKRLRGTLLRAWKRFIIEEGENLNYSDQTANISLYTARHIFAEEVRRSGQYTGCELAAMLGHTTLTNQVFYGPKSRGLMREHKFVLPRPWPGDADAIKAWDELVHPQYLWSASQNLNNLKK